MDGGATNEFSVGVEIISKNVIKWNSSFNMIQPFNVKFDENLYK
jgi:hypothetical protein